MPDKLHVILQSKIRTTDVVIMKSSRFKKFTHLNHAKSLTPFRTALNTSFLKPNPPPTKDLRDKVLCLFVLGTHISEKFK